MREGLKIAIVGAGVSGLYIAWKLAQKDHNVTVFEKRSVVGKEVCSGLFSERILSFVPESKKLIENQIDYCLIHFPKKTLKVSFSKKFFVMSHAKLDNLTLDLAISAGTQVLFDKQMSISDVPKMASEFDRIIGCDGAVSQVRRALKLKEPKFYVGIQGFAYQKNNDNYVDAWPTPNGFLWKIPRNGEVEYGIMEKPENAKKMFDQFLRDHNIKLEITKAAVIPQGLIFSTNKKFALCGDAAGMTKPWSGGGVAWSLTAADILLKNFPNFLKYQEEVKRSFLPRIIVTDIVTKGVYFFGFKIPWLMPKNYKIESDFLVT